MKGQELLGFSAGIRAQAAIVDADAAMADLVATVSNKAAALALEIPEPTLSKKLRYLDRNALSYREAVKLLVAAPRECAKAALAPVVAAIGCKPLEDAPPSDAERDRFIELVGEELSASAVDRLWRKARGL